MTRTTIPQDPPRPQRSRWINEGELKCLGPGCGKPIPAGWYGRTKKRYLCSMRCTTLYTYARRAKVQCTCGCGTWFVKKGTQHTKPFYKDHYYAWRKRQTEQKKGGKWVSLVREYMADNAPRHYSESSLKHIRSHLLWLLEYLHRKKIRSLNAVKPKTILAFMNDARKHRPNSVSDMMGVIRRFFDWLILTERRKTINPVLATLYRESRAVRLPRPFEAEELGIIHRVLEEGGQLQLQIAVLLGEHSGLRISEACAIHLSDLDLAAQEIRIRIPTKVKRERVALLSNPTKALIEKWLAVRDECQHDYLLVDDHGNRMQAHTLRRRLRKILIGEGKLSSFSFHRLRARAATRQHRAKSDLSVIMRLYGWQNPAVAAGYIASLPDDLKAEFARAVEERSQGVRPEPEVKSLDEFFVNDPDDGAEAAPKVG